MRTMALSVNTQVERVVMRHGCPRPGGRQRESALARGGALAHGVPGTRALPLAPLLALLRARVGVLALYIFLFSNGFVGSSRVLCAVCVGPAARTRAGRRATGATRARAETPLAKLARAQRTRIQSHRPHGFLGALLSSAQLCWSSWAPE